MTTSDQFLLALQAYQEIRAELQPVQPPAAAHSNPLESVVPSSSLPGGALLLGLAEDGLPVLLDLYDPLPGPLLVAGDGGSGKTAFLKSLARTSNLQEPGDISFGVLTPFPEEWTAQETLPHCLGVYPAYHPSALDFIAQLVNWAEILPETHQAVLLLFDGFDLMAGSDLLSGEDLRWLLTAGPEHQVWPVLSVNPSRLAHLKNWLDYFHTRVIGQMRNPRNIRSLVGEPPAGLAELLPGKQFGLFQSESWLKFWLPPQD
jgi:hypothetical protein